MKVCVFSALTRPLIGIRSSLIGSDKEKCFSKIGLLLEVFPCQEKCFLVRRSVSLSGEANRIHKKLFGARL